ncbi:MAG TPA: hypothetical protein VGP48_01015 [Stellaceae bacterium]|jgi:uncharacterized protein involved in exopolysaccharide biosynthesis|nr:hypothetical protein [Stellaceae bacterium]
MASKLTAYPLTPREIIALVCRDWRKLAIAFAVPPVLAIIAAFLMTPQYQATSTLLVKAGREYLGHAEAGGGGGATGPQETMDETINSEIGILTSRTLAESVIRKIGLARLYPKLATGGDDSGVMDEAVDSFVKDLEADPIKVSNVISIGFRHPDLATALATVNAVVDAFQEAHARVYSEPRSPYIEGQLKELTQRLQQLEDQRSKGRLQSGIFNADQQRTDLINLRSDAERQLLAADSQYAELQGRLKTLAEEAQHVDATTVSTDSDNTTLLGTAEAQLLSLRQQEHDLLTRLQPSTPEVQNLQSQIRLVEDAIARAKDFSVVRKAPNPLLEKAQEEMLINRADLQPATERAAALHAAIARYDEQLKNLETNGLTLRQLDQEIDGLSASVRDAEQRLVQAQFEDSLDKSNVVSIGIIERATGSAKAVAPRKLLFLAGGIVAGGALSGFLVLLAILSQNTLLMAESVARALNLPVLVTVAEREGRRFYRRAA